jgi:hypothetical protein
MDEDFGGESGESEAAILRMALMTTMMAIFCRIGHRACQCGVAHDAPAACILHGLAV